MKILFLSHHWTNNSHHSRHSGFQRLVAEAAKTHEVTLITWSKEESEYQDEQGITVITIKASRKDFLFKKRLGISRMGQKISGKFDVVHALYSDCTFHLPEYNYIVTFHVLPGIVNYYSIKQKIFIRLKYWVLQRRAMRRSKNIVCVSNNLLNLIPQRYRSKTQLIPHGVDTDFWDPKLCTDSAYRDLQPFVLCVGSHGLDRQLLEDFIVQNPKVRFVLVGQGGNTENHNNVRCLSNLKDEELRSLYSHAAAIIKPLLFATANNSILEALSMGKTIITNRISGITDYLDDSTCVFIDRLPGKDITKLASFTLDQDFIRNHAIKNFSWKVILGQYFRCYTNKPQRQ